VQGVGGFLCRGYCVRSVVSAGKENDWAVLKIKPNSITKRLPGDQRGFYTIVQASFNPLPKIALVGYGASNNKNAFLQRTSSLCPTFHKFIHVS
jgi:hypothetical protein